MQCFLRGTVQHTTEESNSFRLITNLKVRWMVQSGQCLIHTFHLISFIGDYVLVGADISNKYCPPLSFGAAEDDQAIASKFFLSFTNGNELREYVENERWDKDLLCGRRWMLLVYPRTFLFLFKKKFATLH